MDVLIKHPFEGFLNAGHTLQVLEENSRCGCASQKRNVSDISFYCGEEKLEAVTSGMGLRGKKEYVTRRDAGIPMQNFPMLNQISPEQSTLNRVELKS